jgi:hypothetical protein
MAVLGDLTATRVRRSSNVVSRVVADEAIVVPIRRGAADLDSIYTFNESGTASSQITTKPRVVPIAPTPRSQQQQPR